MGMVVGSRKCGAQRARRPARRLLRPLLSARDRVFLWPVGPTLVRNKPLVTAGFCLGDIEIPRGGSRGAPWTS